jgi:sodium pump decarboxylase gamma subunit
MSEIMSQGFVLMCVGMLVVFAFLSLLVFCMGLAAAFFKRFAYLFPEKNEEESNLRSIATDYTEIAVAVAAATAYGKRRVN